MKEFAEDAKEPKRGKREKILHETKGELGRFFRGQRKRWRNGKGRDRADVGKQWKDK